MSQPTSPSNQPVNRPIMKIQVESITVSIWEREGQFGPMHSCTIQRSYLRPAQEGEASQRSDGQVWANTGSIPPGQMLAAEKAIDRAHTWCLNRTEQWRRQRAEQVQPASSPTKVSTNGKQRLIKLPGGGSKLVDEDVAAAYEAALEIAQDVRDAA